ncbi:glycosyltransferase [Smaragdicoccus niigatensis]|uniref:glycosyltransferase n=1 Tax=Smaragdicoccus niigatensis TaxID=359359 RepID=UPI000362451C|nr:glycosyltransferase [Smaragdicoccus niigatensis]
MAAPIRMHPEFVSVVIPAYGALPHIVEQLDALTNQTYTGTWEVVISDNGNNVTLAEVIAEHPIHLVAPVRVIDSTDVRGVSHARNVGIQAARGDLIAFLDHDDHAHPEWLAAMASRAPYFDAISGSRDITKLNSSAAQAWRPLQSPEDGFKFPNSYRMFVGANVAIWRDVLESVGDWDTEFIGGADDLDYAFRIQQAGYTIGHAHDARVDYRLRDDLRSACRQVHNYAIMDARLHQKHRDLDWHNNDPKMFALNMLSLVVYNPLVPNRWRAYSRGQWAMRAAFMAGRIRGSIRYRTLTL